MPIESEGRVTAVAVGVAGRDERGVEKGDEVVLDGRWPSIFLDRSSRLFIWWGPKVNHGGWVGRR